jgi:hypothetical protein
VRVAVLLAVVFVLSGCAVGGTKTTTVTVTRTVTSPSGPKKPPAAQAETASVKYFGTPVSATKVDQKCSTTNAAGTTVYFVCYTLTIKPAFFLVGVTANAAFAAGQTPPVSCAPLACTPVEDDRWVIPAGTQNLVFILPAKTTGTVLTTGAKQMRTTTITGLQLAGLVTNPGTAKPKLMESLASGVWLDVNVDTVTSFAQQFQP